MKTLLIVVVLLALGLVAWMAFRPAPKATGPKAFVPPPVNQSGNSEGWFDTAGDILEAGASIFSTVEKLWGDGHSSTNAENSGGGGSDDLMEPETLFA